jgi:hypothetical protein
VRWHYRDGGLLWPFVPAYAIHVAEEWFGGFPRWLGQIGAGPMPESVFVSINAVAMVLLVAAVRAATRTDDRGWLAVTIAMIALINTALHAGGTVVTRSYSPGLISAAMLYVPLGSLTMIRAIDQAPRGQIARGVTAAILLHLLASIVALTAARAGGG